MLQFWLPYKRYSFITLHILVDALSPGSVMNPIAPAFILDAIDECENPDSWEALPEALAEGVSTALLHIFPLPWCIVTLSSSKLEARACVTNKHTTIYHILTNKTGALFTWKFECLDESSSRSVCCYYRRTISMPELIHISVDLVRLVWNTFYGGSTAL